MASWTVQSLLDSPQNALSGLGLDGTGLGGGLDALLGDSCAVATPATPGPAGAVATPEAEALTPAFTDGQVLADAGAGEGVGATASYSRLPFLDASGGFVASRDVSLTPLNGFDPSRPTTVIIHGWNNNKDSPWLQEMGQSILKADPNRNVLVVGWGAGADRVFPNDAAFNINATGHEVAARLRQMGVNPASTDFVAHSFGTYVSNVAAHDLGGARNLYALDPANPMGLNPTNLPDINFAHNFKQSVAYHTGEVAGSPITTADEDFVVKTPYWGVQDFAGKQHGYAITFFENQLNSGGPWGLNGPPAGIQKGLGFEGTIDLQGRFHPGDPRNPFDSRR